MDDPSYRQLHQIACGSVRVQNRVRLVDTCLKGYIVCVADEGVLLYNLQRYLKATETCTLRRDKSLPDHPPDVLIKVPDPVSWVAFNSEGLALAVVISNASQGTFVNLVNLTDLLKRTSVDLTSVARPVRVCGGDSEYELRDFAWSPTVPAAFVLILRSGEVRLFNASACPTESCTLVSQLQPNVDAQCLSWSAKGKQLAVCMSGHLSTSNGVAQGPMIVQMDPTLRLKRVVQLNTVFGQIADGSAVYPTDLLWVSPACFIIGLHLVAPSGQSCLRSVFINAPTKSNEVTYAEIKELRAVPEHGGHIQYYFHAVGTSHFLATHSADGEEIILFLLPTTSSVPPQAVLNIELPPGGSPLGMCLGFCELRLNSGALSAYLVTRLTNGHLSPFVLHKFEKIMSVPTTLPEPLPLQTPAPPQAITITRSSLPTVVATQDQSVAAMTPPSLFAAARTSCIPNRTSSITSDKTVLTVTTVNNESGNGTAFDPSTWNRNSTESRIITSESVRSKQLSITPLQAVSPAVATGGGGVVHLPKSIHVASTQFTAALDTEAEASRSAWRDLFELMNHGSQMSSQSSEATGIDVTEAHLHDTELFLSALDKVLRELKNGTKERKQDLSNSVAYAEKVRRTLRLYAGGDWIPLLTSQLDPEAARLLSRVKRQARLVESSLFDLDTQLDAILSPNAPSSGPPTASNHTSISSSEPLTNKSDNLPSSKLLSALETTKRLLCTENGRVKCILESFRRLRLTTSLQSQEGDELESSVRTPSSWYSHRSSTRPVDRSRDETVLLNDVNISPAYQSLLQRDLALYRLFANYKLNTVHAPLVCPVVDQAVGSDDALIKPECEVSSPLSTERVSVTHPQQVKLDQLINHSGQAASVSSPPIKSSALPNTEFLNSDRSIRTHSTTSSTPPRIQVIPASSQQPITNGVKFDAVMPTTFTSPISTDQEAKSTVADPRLSGSFLLGTKAASASFVSPTLQKPLTPSTNLTLPDQNSPVSNARSSFVVETATTTVSAPSVPPTFAGITTLTQESSSVSLDSPISQATVITTVASTPFPKLTGLMSSANITPSTSAASVTSNAPPTTTKTSPFSLFSSPSTGNLFGQSHGIPSTGSSPVTPISFGTPTSVTGIAAITTTTSTMGSLFSTSTAATSSVTSISNKPVFSFGALSPNVSSTTAPTFNTSTVATTATALTTSLFAGGLIGPKQSEPTPSTTTTAFSPTASIQTATTTTTGLPQVTTVAGIFSAPTTSSSLFGGFGVTTPTSTTSQVVITTTASAGGISSPSMSLFGTPATTGFSGGLFGSTFKATSTTATTTSVAGLFGAIVTSPASTVATTTSGTSGGLFQFAQNTTSTSPFGAPPTLFGRPSTTQPANSGLFGFTSATSPSTTVSITSTTITTTVPGGLFGAFSPGQQSPLVAPSGGLFGAPAAAGDQTKDVNSLFSGSSFGLGSTGPVQNVFGRASNTDTTTGSSLSTGGTVGQGLFGSTKPSTGLFGAPAFAPPTTTTGAGSMSLFGSKPSFTAQAPTGSSLFSAAHQSPPAAGFGSPPVFGDSPLFGGQPTFGFGGSAAFTASAPATGNVGLFGAGGSPAGGGSLFGSATAAASASGGGLFAALAAKTDNPSFGSLAMGSPQTAPASPFGASPSFTQRPPVQKASSQGHSSAPKLGLKNSSPKTKHEKQKLPSAVSKRLSATKQLPPPLVISPTEPPPDFYSNAKTYWSQVSPTVDGMLGGYSSLNVPDIEDSHLFLDEFGPVTTAYALDCGSGIGRVTKQLLIPRFNFVDMVEVTQSFLDQAKEYIGEEDFDSIGERFCSGLQDFTPPVGRYDLIWIQWVLGHLTDVALVGFLQRCARALSVDGVIVVKENITSGNPDDQIAEATFDELDSSFTRSRKAFLDLFDKSDLVVSGEKLQTNFPSSIYPVRMFALRPRKINISPTAPDINSALPT
ncbi:hypothetical protein PHET_04338 [Paragonimus heterotremus]|uniref:Alpha N-terminal protein methyltransferase 1 n=1 Tax=Paragonimus heterotremus TaxID=100268 RepID=A0A8J4T9Q4_9TREM|nr:hypothetical protein PHET_04338 [Paragonimus heterotremus]